MADHYTASERARYALNAYMRINPETDGGSALTDLIADLRHMAHDDGVDSEAFAAKCTCAETSFIEEMAHEDSEDDEDEG